jgi:quercetin dioxygenase-like cupin family protein
MRMNTGLYFMRTDKAFREFCRAAIAVIALCLPPAAHAQDAELGKIELPSEIAYKGLPGALQIATLFGDPAKPGVFVQRYKFPAGLKLMPHSHPDQPRTVAILSGTLYYAFGDAWDEAKLRPLPPGAFFTEPPNVAHFAWAKDGEVELQLTSIGPTGSVFVKAPGKD